MRRMVVAVVVGCALAGACGDDDDGGTGGAADGRPLSALLAQIPAGHGDVVHLADWQGARAAAGVDQPATDADVDDVVDVRHRSALRPLGESLRLAVFDGRAVLTRRTDTIEDFLALADDDDQRSLADDDDLAAVVGALDGHGVLRAVAGDGALAAAPVPADPGATDDGPALARPRAWASGVAVVDGEPTLVAVLAYGSADAAGDAADVVRTRLEDGTSLVARQRWSELVGGAEVATDGRLVVAIGSIADHPRLWLQMVEARDALLAS